MPDAPTARALLGMPVPPPWAARAATVARNGLGHLHSRMVPGFNLVLERLFGVVDVKALAAAVELGVPDALAGGPLTSAELASRCGADADALDRLLAYLATRDLFRRDRLGRYANTAGTAVLARDADPPWGDWVRFLSSPWAATILDALAERVRTGRPASEIALGSPFFEFVHEHPEAAAAFDGAMAAGSSVQAALFAETIDLAGVRRVCDVGGGTGSVAAHLARAHPRLEVTVLDLPGVAAAAAPVIDAPDLGGRVRFVAGDFFEAVPSDHDVYTLFAIVHDWGDDDVVRILGRIRQAVSPGGRVLVTERPLPSGNRADFARASDVLMLAFGDGGRERTVAAYDALFARAGFVVSTRTVLPSLFEVFELRPR